MKVVILTPTLQEGDAVSNDVLGMASNLRQMGHRVILAVRTMNKKFPVVSYRQIPELLDSPDDVLIYHHSISFEEAIRLVERLPCRKYVKYHNVTPPKFFEGINRDLIRYCSDGVKQLARLCRPDVTFWADSAFNGQDVLAIQPEQSVTVLPPFNQVDALLDAVPDPMGIGMVDDWVTNIMVVGRIVPNKNIMLAIDTFAEYHTRYESHSRLVLVGENHHPAYSAQVYDRIYELNLTSKVVFAGKVTLEQLKAYFLVAQVLLTTSSHEGFCLPLIEAMGMRVPLVAVPNTAIPGTAGDAALYGSDAESLAAAMHQLRRDRGLREQQMLRGIERYRDAFHNDAISRQFRELLAVNATERIAA